MGTQINGATLPVGVIQQAVGVSEDGQLVRQADVNGDGRLDTPVFAVKTGADTRLLAGGEFVESVRGHALIADSAVASVAVPETPTVQVWPNVRAPDIHYNSTTGALEFQEGGFSPPSPHGA